MNVKQRPVHNAANFALFLGNVATALLRLRRKHLPAFSLTDLKADYRGRFYVLEALKRLPHLPDPVFIDELSAHFGRIGAIHP